MLEIFADVTVAGRMIVGMAVGWLWWRGGGSFRFGVLLLIDEEEAVVFVVVTMVLEIVYVEIL